MIFFHSQSIYFTFIETTFTRVASAIKKQNTSTWEKSRWIKHTVLEANGSVLSPSVGCTAFSASTQRSLQHKSHSNSCHCHIFTVCLLGEKWKNLQMEPGSREHFSKVHKCTRNTSGLHAFSQLLEHVTITVCIISFLITSLYCLITCFWKHIYNICHYLNRSFMFWRKPTLLLNIVLFFQSLEIACEMYFYILFTFRCSKLLTSSI